jgi:hypothetical protein
MTELSKTKAKLNEEISLLKEENEVISQAFTKLQMMAAMQQVIFTVTLSLIPSEHNPLNYPKLKDDLLNKITSDEVEQDFLETESEANFKVYKALVSQVIEDMVNSYNHYMAAENNAEDNQKN